MPDYQLIGARGEDIPVAMSGPTGQVGEVGPDDVILFTFPSYSHDAAMGIFRACKDAGIRRTLGEKHGRGHVGRWWQFPGSSGHLVRAAQRLGVSSGAIFRAEQDPNVKAISTPLGGCYERYKAVKGPTKDDRDFSAVELREVEGLLAECRKHDARLHALADAGRTMIEDCAAAFGLPPGEYRYRVVAAGEDVHPAAAAELAALRAEVARLNAEAKDAADRHRDETDRLRAENAELLDQNKTLAAMVESLTAPAPATPPAGPEPAPAAEQAAPTSPPRPATPRPQNKAR